MYNIVNNDAPTYLSNILLIEAEETWHNLQNTGNISTIRGHMKAFDNSFLLRTIIISGTVLTRNIKDAPTLNTFSSHLDGVKQTRPKWHLTGNRRMAIMHAHLCMSCSPLNDHLYSHIHVVDNPACQCGFQRENNKHFLLECHSTMKESK